MKMPSNCMLLVPVALLALISLKYTGEYCIHLFYFLDFLCKKKEFMQSFSISIKNYQRNSKLVCTRFQWRKERVWSRVNGTVQDFGLLDHEFESRCRQPLLCPWIRFFVLNDSST